MYNNNIVHTDILTHTHSQLSKVLEIYWELQVRHAHLAHTTVHAAISSAQCQLSKMSTKDSWTEVDNEVEGTENGEQRMGNGEVHENGGSCSQLEDELFSNFITNLMIMLNKSKDKKKSDDKSCLFNATMIR